MARSDVEYINAHAAGTVVGDAVEGRAILDVFGEDCPAVSSTKALSGHECWMAGASEIAYTLLMCDGGFLACTRNYAGPDEGSRLVRRESYDYTHDDETFNFKSSSIPTGSTAVIPRL